MDYSHLLLFLFCSAKLSFIGITEATKTSTAMNTIRQYLKISSKSNDSIIEDLIKHRDEKGSLIIHRAAKDRRLDVIKALVEIGEDVNARGHNEETALHIAASGGDEIVAGYLLSQHADLEAKDSQGYAPIHTAAEAGQLGVVKLLTEQGADIHNKCKNERTSVTLPPLMGDEDLFKLLESESEDPEDRNFYGTSLIQAATEARQLAVLKLLHQPADSVSIPVSAGKTALRLAVERKYDNMVEYLLSKHGDLDGINLHQKGQEDDQKLLADVKIIRDLLLNDPDSAEESTRKDLFRRRDGFKLIHFAAEEGRLDVIKALIRLGGDVNAKSNSGRTALHLAAREGHEDVVEFLLSHNADPEIKDNEGDASTHLAAKKGHLNVLKTLLDSGVDSNLRGRAGLTVLHIAVRGNYEGIVDLVLSKNADPEVKTKWEATPLQFAIHRGSETIVKKLLDNGAKVDKNSTKILNLAIEKNYLEVVKFLNSFCDCIDYSDEKGLTPLHVAVMTYNKIVTNLLLETGVNKTNSFLDKSSTLNITNAENATEVHDLAPLHVASIYGFTEIGQMLVSYGAYVDIRDERSYTPLHYAIENGHSDLVKILLAAGANKNNADISGLTPLHIASRNGQLEIVKLLLSHHSFLNAKDTYKGYVPLHYAVWNGFNGTVKMLLDAGADKESRDRNHESPLFLGSAAGHLEIVEMLMAAGANVTITDINGMTPLHIASREGYPQIVELLLERNNFLLEWRDVKGFTPLHLAVMKRYKPVLRRSSIAIESEKLKNVKILLRHGVNVNVTSYSDMTPLHIASRDGFLQIVKLLLSNDANPLAKDKQSSIPLQYAAMGNHNDIVLTFLDPSIVKLIDESYLESSLIISSKKGHYEVAKTFLEYSVDPDATDVNNRTSLHMACMGGYKKMVRLLLLSFRATTIDAKDRWGWRPLNYAASWRGHTETVGLLFKIKSDALLPTKPKFTKIERNITEPERKSGSVLYSLLLMYISLCILIIMLFFLYKYILYIYI